MGHSLGHLKSLGDVTQQLAVANESYSRSHTAKSSNVVKFKVNFTSFDTQGQIFYLPIADIDLSKFVSKYSQ
jgi:hypothetical protein